MNIAQNIVFPNIIDSSFNTLITNKNVTQIKKQSNKRKEKGKKADLWYTFLQKYGHSLSECQKNKIGLLFIKVWLDFNDFISGDRVVEQYAFLCF